MSELEHSPSTINRIAANPRRAVIGIGVAAAVAFLSSPQATAEAAPERQGKPLDEIHHVGQVAMSAAKSKSARNKPETIRWVPSITGQKRSLGVAVSSRYIDSPNYVSMIDQYFDEIVPENELKSEAVVPPFGYNLKLEDFERIVQTWSMPVRGHTFAFGGQDPLRIQRLGDRCQKGILGDQSRASREFRKVTYNFVTSTMKRYRGRVTEYDVVNEPLRYDGRLQPNAWFKCMGPGYIGEVLKVAQTADSGAKTYINENGAELPGIKLDGLVDMVRNLKNQGAPLYGVGLQTHVTLDFLDHIKDFEATLKRLASLDVVVKLTELDVALPANPTAADFEKQTKVYEAVTRACIKQAACVGMVIWGVSDDKSWLSKNSPTLFRYVNNYIPKPAYKIIRRMLR